MHSRPKTGQLHAVEKYLYHTGSITRPVHCHAQNWHSALSVSQAQDRWDHTAAAVNSLNSVQIGHKGRHPLAANAVDHTLEPLRQSVQFLI